MEMLLASAHTRGLGQDQESVTHQKPSTHFKVSPSSDVWGMQYSLECIHVFLQFFI